MVRLVLFDRKLDIATDDLYLPSAIIAIFRIIWIAALTFTIIIIISDHCDLPKTVGLYVLMHLILSFISLNIECLSVYVSMSGTVNNEKPRSKMTLLAQIETIFIILDLALQLYGTYVTYNQDLISNSLVCSKDSISIGLVKMVVIWAFICDFFFIFVFGLFVFISKSNKMNSDVQNYLLTWKRRIEWLVSNPEKMDRKGDGQKVIADVAGLFARFFKDVDWAPSDVAVGLILLKREHKILRQVTDLRRANPVSTTFWEGLLRMQNSANLEVEGASYPPIFLNDFYSNAPSSEKATAESASALEVLQNKQSPSMTSSSKQSSPVSTSSKLMQSTSSSPLIETPKGIEMQELQRDTSAETLQESFSPDRSLTGERKSSVSSSNAGSMPLNFHSFIQSLNMRNPLELLSLSNTPTSTPKSESINLQQQSFSKRPLDFRRRSEVLGLNEDAVPFQINPPRPRSYSFTLASKSTPHFHQSHQYTGPKSPRLRQSHDWSFSAYSFTVSPNATEMKRPDILDVIHFCHYANMAYVTLDPEIQKKSDILLHFSPRNHLFQAPYLVSLDHDWNSIVIAIRGTYSISDVLVDLKFDTEVLDCDLNEAEKYQVHAGFLKTATNIVDDIIKHDVLGKTMREGKESMYHIVVCGHSLGAGLSSIVAYLLRKKGFLRTRCYGYGMPCVGNEHVAKLFNEFCLSVVVGDDLISRLSINSCEILKNDVARILDRCNLPKYKIFASAIANNCMCCFGEVPEKRKSLLTRTQNGVFPEGSTESLQESEIAQIVENATQNSTTGLYKRVLENQTVSMPESQFVQLYIPGRILYCEKIRISSPVLTSSMHSENIQVVVEDENNSKRKETIETKPKRKRGAASLNAMKQALQERLIIAKYQSFDSKYVYTPRWAEKEEFCEIIVSRTMIRDHNAIFGMMAEFDKTDPKIPLKVLS